MINAAWVSEILPYVRQVSASTGVYPSVLLALAAEETGYGASALAAQNNLSGIRYVGQAGARQVAGGFAAYPSLSAWATDMTRVLDLSYYSAVRSASTPQAQIAALAESPYNGASAAARKAWGTLLEEVRTEQGYAMYDTGSASASSGSASSTWSPSVTHSGSTVTVDLAGAPTGTTAQTLAVLAAVAVALVVVSL